MAESPSGSGRLHGLLQRQLHRCEGTADLPPATWKGFVAAVHQAYVQADEDRVLLDRSMDLASRELVQRNDDLRRDITARVEAERALVANQARMQALVDGLPDVILRISKEGKVLDWHGRRSDGYEGNAVPGLPEGQRGVLLGHIACALESRAVQVWEYEAPSPSVAARHFEARLAASGDDEVIAIVRDVTETKIRTAELKASMERYKTLVESTNAVPWEMDGRTFKFSYISPMVTKLFGYEVGDIVGRTPSWDRIQADDRDRVKGEFAKLADSRDGEEVDIEYRYCSAARRTMHVRSMVRVHRDAATDTVILRGITLDITMQKKLEMDLRQSQKLESVGRLAAGVAHEINTPIQFVSDSIHFVRDAIKDLAGLIDKYREFHHLIVAGAPAAAAATDVTNAEEDADLPYLLENIPKALDRSLDGAGRVATIVQSMKEFAYPDQKEMTPVDLNQAIRSTLTIARSEYKYVAVVETNFAEIPLVTCHVGDVNQAVLNVVVNAAHAIADRIKGTDQKGRITVRTSRDGDRVVIGIADTGGGIPEEIRDRIFDPFFTTKEVGRGTGQGLAIARSVIIEKHGGELIFETEPGQGTTFFIRLPIDGGQHTMGAAA